MNISVVYSKVNAALPLPEGGTASVHVGQHFPADDPLVRKHPNAFTADPRFGMSFTGEPPAYMQRPPEEPAVVESTTARPGERRTVRRVD